MIASALKAHALVELVADDPATKADLEAFCAQTGSTLISAVSEGPVLRAVVRRKDEWS